MSKQAVKIQNYKTLIIKYSVLISLIISVIITLSINSQTKSQMRSYSYNPQLKNILPANQWEGNPIENNQFINQEFPFKPTFSMAWRQITERNPQKEAKKNDTFKLPIVTDISFLNNNRNVIVWLGNASFFIRVAGINIITDPVFYNASIAKRKSPMPFDVNLLKNINYILISHDHRDHLDKESLQLLYKNNKSCEILSGLKMDEWFNEMVQNSKVQTAGWYQQYNTDTTKIKIYFMPARHWSRRGLWDTNKHLWGSFLIEANGTKIYFSGDTGYGSHLKQVGELFHGIDICIMGIGAYKPEWFMSPNHISPFNAVKAVNEMNAKQFIPMHYGTFDFGNEPIGEPIRMLYHENEAKKLNAELKVLAIGQNYYLNE